VLHLVENLYQLDSIGKIETRLESFVAFLPSVLYDVEFEIFSSISWENLDRSRFKGSISLIYFLDSNTYHCCTCAGAKFWVGEPTKIKTVFPVQTRIFNENAQKHQKDLLYTENSEKSLFFGKFYSFTSPLRPQLFSDRLRE